MGRGFFAPPISIHSSHTGRDGAGRPSVFAPTLFQSTLPIREETGGRRPDGSLYYYFNPLFPYGKRLHLGFVVVLHILFQSTLPIREETDDVCIVLVQRILISIHSSHTGRDDGRIAHIVLDPIFQSTLPIREETRIFAHSSSSALVFQSTLPIREETRCHRDQLPHRRFQSTLPIREETALSETQMAQANFNPLSPHGERQSTGTAGNNP